jgi:putative tryptophan/tyrosine transport system substrate-binding protein
VRRREFIIAVGGAAITWPLRSFAQRSEKVAQLGYLAQARISHLLEALYSGLRDAGYVEGQNFQMEYRFEHGQLKSLEELARELAALKPDLLVAVGTPATLAAKEATSSIPVVMAPAGDPVRTGLVKNLARPSGNVTGVTLYSTDLAIKRLELATEVLAGIRRVAVLGNARNPQTALNWDDIQPAGRSLGLELRLFSVATIDDLSSTISAMKSEHFEAVVVLSDADFNAARTRMIALCATHRLPAVFEGREFVDDGGLLSYGPNIGGVTRRSAAYIDKLLKGARPSDLPIEQPTKFELVINLKTSTALGLAMPASLLARADEVIE